MKNYDEITNDLLERRNTYVIGQKRKRKKIISITAPLGVVCLTALVAVGLWQSDIFVSEPTVLCEDSVIPGEKDYIEPHELENTEPSAYESENIICIQEVSELPSVEKMLFALHTEDFIPMTRDEINEYYGMNIFPSVPDYLTENATRLGIYKRKSNGELYYDGNKISYSDSSSTRGIAVNVDKDTMPYDFGNTFGIIEGDSVIKNVRVGIAKTPEGEMLAQFSQGRTCFRIFSFGLTQDEFIAIIESLLP